MKASQIGWTYFLIGYIFKRISEAASGRQCPIMMLFAKERDGKSFNDEKLVVAAGENTCLDGVVDMSASRRAGNSWWFKKFPNGFLKIVGSNSPGNLKSTSSVGLGIVEEPDDTSDDVKGQGDSISNLEERLKRYTGSVLIVGGTPAVKGLSKTEHRINSSDARVLPVVCHSCGESHVLDWDNVTWDGKDGNVLDVDKETGEVRATRHDIYGYSRPETARYVCPDCGSVWDDYQRQKNIRDTVFDAIQAGDKNAGWVSTKPFFGKAGFMELSELYACIPGTSLADVVREYLEAEHLANIGDESKRIKFVNQKLGRPYEFKSDAPDIDALRERCEDYEELVVPAGGYILTAGVDLQHDRIAIVIKAWGRGEESWLIYAGEIYGNVADKQDPVWDELAKILLGNIKHSNGRDIRIRSISIDSSDGVTSEAAYSFVRKHQRRDLTLMAVKGSSNDYGSKEIFSRPRIVETRGRNNTKAAKHGLKIYIVGTHRAKDLISGRMKLTGSGAGRMHWYKSVRDDYFSQMTGEVKAPNRMGRRTWQQKAGAAIEFWDCEVYALHAARAIKLHLMTDQQWRRIEASFSGTDVVGDTKIEHEADEVQTTQERRTAQPRKRQRGGFVRNWRR